MLSRAGLVLMVILAVEAANIKHAANANATTVNATTAETTTTTDTTTTSTLVDACPSGWIDAQIYGCFNILEATNLTGAEAMIACEEVGSSKQMFDMKPLLRLAAT